MKHRRLAYVDRFAPPYVCSMGCHILNLENKERKFYFVSGRVADLRLHNFFIAPSGFFKSEVLYQLLDDDTGLLSGSRIGTAFEGGMTAAAFVGTVKINKEGEAVIEYGAAKIHARNIIGIEEFAEITNMMKQSYNVQMADALLTSLDKGWVRKRLARSGEKGIHYPTNLSMWTGSQPTRLELSSGIGRRFHMLEFIPSREERRVIARHRRQGRGVRTSARRVMRIKNALEEIIDKVKLIERIDFTKEFDDFLGRFELIHYEEELMERMAMGYTVMNGEFDKVLQLRITKELEGILEHAIKERKSVKMGSDINQVVYVLQDYGGDMTISEMIFELAYFGLDSRTSYKLIMTARDIGRISVSGSTLSTKWARAKKK